MAMSIPRPLPTAIRSPRLREALYAGVIAFGLFVLFIGLKTDQNIRNELILVQRWGLLAIVVGARHGGPLRLHRVAYIRRWIASRKAAAAKAAPVRFEREPASSQKHPQ
jgi:branched-chain amino acid transport system permease protein